jgi:hypothetical protein
MNNAIEFQNGSLDEQKRQRFALNVIEMEGLLCLSCKQIWPTIPKNKRERKIKSQKIFVDVLSSRVSCCGKF